MARILLIDDDPALLSVLATALTCAGHEVIQATDGKEGVAVARITPLDLVITDLIMPVQEGVETIAILRKELPQLPVIAISGGVPNATLYLDVAAKIGAKRVLAKPFTPAEILEAITAVLAPPA